MSEQTKMSEQAIALAARLIRNVREVPLHHFVREPLYESERSNISRDTAAKKLGASFNVLAPGKRICPYHLHHAQEELFVVLEGFGTLRVVGEMLPIKAGDIISAQIVLTSELP